MSSTKGICAMTKSLNTTAIEIIVNHPKDDYWCFGKCYQLIDYLNVFKIPFSVLCHFSNKVKVNLERLLVKLLVRDH